ncbi:restin homolog-like protein [Babesia caballi]|uniref:Restin homolog-like protein n=1 Tax=Babesia caballi TaxID=5871 RepID=A0AAV4LND5_BABCB|nr:restin homolog-like protein [Babesia caballi]
MEEQREEAPSAAGVPAPSDAMTITEPNPDSPLADDFFYQKGHAELPHVEDAVYAALQKQLADKERECRMLEEQLVQANRQVETCYYQLEGNENRIRQYSAEVEEVRHELERRDRELNSARREYERIARVEAEKNRLSIEVEDLTRDLAAKINELESARASTFRLEGSVAEITEENTRLRREAHAIESECEAQKRKASEMYSLYQQVREENLHLVKELRSTNEGVRGTVPPDVPLRSTDLEDKLEQANELCSKQEKLLLERDAQIKILQQQVKQLERDHRKGSEARAAPAAGAAASDSELQRLSNDVRMLKMSNSGLSTELSALRSQMAEKNARINHLNCELMSLRHGRGPAAGGNVDLEDYMSDRKSGFNNSRVTGKLDDAGSTIEALWLAAADPKHRRWVKVHEAIGFLLLLGVRGGGSGDPGPQLAGRRGRAVAAHLAVRRVHEHGRGHATVEGVVGGDGGRVAVLLYGAGLREHVAALLVNAAGQRLPALRLLRAHARAPRSRLPNLVHAVRVAAQVAGLAVTLLPELADVGLVEAVGVAQLAEGVRVRAVGARLPAAALQVQLAHGRLDQVRGLLELALVVGVRALPAHAPEAPLWLVHVRADLRLVELFHRDDSHLARHLGLRCAGHRAVTTLAIRFNAAQVSPSTRL